MLIFDVVSASLLGEPGHRELAFLSNLRGRYFLSSASLTLWAISFVELSHFLFLLSFSLLDYKFFVDKGWHGICSDIKFLTPIHLFPTPCSSVLYNFSFCICSVQ